MNISGKFNHKMSNEEYVWINDVVITSDDGIKTELSHIFIQKNYAGFGTITQYGSLGILFSRHEYNLYYDFASEKFFGDCISCGEWYDLDHDEAQEIAEELGLNALVPYLNEMRGKLS